MPTIEVKVPDIGDFNDVSVIEVLVKPGDKVAKEASLVTLESDKATMDVPSPVDGTVKELKVKVGDKVSEGSLILTVESEAAGARSPQPSHASGRGSRTVDSGLPSPRGPGPAARRRTRGEAAIPARPISSARCSCSARVPAAIPRRSAAQTSA